ncbi:insulinase family protein [Ruminococcus sp. FC2018]|uniref:EF-P 5-aminopentanol modification-associated protein YfmF n=1 Tax=Ruminococcus sp. FC2018 TaxID=1410617 RepID=UPI00048B91CD|nr:insulinase family protein [Ruminococcus sp. FC2018]
MPISYKRTEVGEGIALTEITDPKFKSNLISVSFVTPTDAHNAPMNTLVMELLASSNAKLKTLAELTGELAYLYGATLSSKSRRIGDCQENGLCIEYICDDYTIGHEVISTRAVELLLDCIFKPLLEDGVFSERYVSMRKKELEDNINAELNDKFGYSMRKAKEIIYKDEPACVSLLGTVENARTITSQQLTDRYYQLLETSQIEIVMCGRDFERVKPVITQAFSELERNGYVAVDYKALSPIKQDTAYERQTQDVNQSKMIMAFKSDYEDIYVTKVFAALLGGTPFSKLFSNVREKMSLCYYCSAAYSDIKGTLMVSSGVAKKDIEKAEEAILMQLEAVKNGEFTGQELEHTKIYLCTGFKSNNDSIYRMAEYYIAQNTRNTSYSPEQVCDIFMGVTRQQVIDCAKSFVYDTFYVMEPEEVTGDE